MTSSTTLILSRRAFVASLLTAPAIIPASARALSAAPSGPVILTVTGSIDPNAAEGGVAFDLAGLDALPQHQTVTATPWHDGRPTFRGPTIASILDAAGAEGSLLRIKALNDYSADMPMADARAFPVILASRIDDAEISVRNKGPLFVIYPFDEQPDLYNEIYFGRSVWQVSEIEVLA